MATYQMPMPPAGTYPWQQQQQQSAYYPQQQNYYSQQQSFSPPQQIYYPPPQYQQQYLAPPRYPQQTPYPSEGRAPPPPPSQAWPDHVGEYMGPGVKYNNYRDDDTPDYNNPPQPQYGIPESKRGTQEGGDSRFVFPNGNGQQTGQPGEGERGLGATVLGGGAGAFLGHKMEHGALGTIGGLAIGAIAANAFEHHEKKKKEERRESRAFDRGYEDGEDQPRHHSHSRNIDDDYYSDDRYEDEEYEPPRHHHHHRDYDEDYYQDDDYQESYRRDDY